jgi:hypothetical protein
MNLLPKGDKYIHDCTLRDGIRHLGVRTVIRNGDESPHAYYQRQCLAMNLIWATTEDRSTRGVSRIAGQTSQVSENR